jgi:PAS domain-containing protein
VDRCLRPRGLHRENVRVEQEISGLGMWYDVHLVPFGDPESLQFVATAADITARKQAEAERQKFAAEVVLERERLRTMVLHTPAPLALLEGEGHRFTIVNAAYRRISAGGRDVTGLTPLGGLPGAGGRRVLELLDRVYRTGEPWNGTEILVPYDRDGTGPTDAWFNLRLAPVCDAQRECCGDLQLRRRRDGAGPRPPRGGAAACSRDSAREGGGSCPHGRRRARTGRRASSWP